MIFLRIIKKKLSSKKTSEKVRNKKLYSPILDYQFS